MELQANREPDFSSLVPPLSPRKLASRVFYLLLGECRYERDRGRQAGSLTHYNLLPSPFPTSAIRREDPSCGTREAIWAPPDPSGPQIPLSKFIKPYPTSLDFVGFLFCFDLFLVLNCVLELVSAVVWEGPKSSEPSSVSSRNRTPSSAGTEHPLQCWDTQPHACLVSECTLLVFAFSELVSKQKTSCLYYSMMSQLCLE